MTNLEKYKNELNNIIDDEKGIAVVDGNPRECHYNICTKCEFKEAHSCTKQLIRWLLKEYEEPKINLPDDIEVDTPILVSDDGECWDKRHFAKLVDNTVHTWSDGCTSFTASCTRVWKYAKLPDDVITLRTMVSELKGYCTGRRCYECKLCSLDKFKVKGKGSRCTGLELSDLELLENKELIIQKHKIIKEEG